MSQSWIGHLDDEKTQNDQAPIPLQAANLIQNLTLVVMVETPDRIWIAVITCTPSTESSWWPF